MRLARGRFWAENWFTWAVLRVLLACWLFFAVGPILAFLADMADVNLGFGTLTYDCFKCCALVDGADEANIWFWLPMLFALAAPWKLYSPPRVPPAPTEMLVETFWMGLWT